MWMGPVQGDSPISLAAEGMRGPDCGGSMGLTWVLIAIASSYHN